MVFLLLLFVQVVLHMGGRWDAKHFLYGCIGYWK